MKPLRNTIPLVLLTLLAAACSGADHSHGDGSHSHPGEEVTSFPDDSNDPAVEQAWSRIAWGSQAASSVAREDISDNDLLAYHDCLTQAAGPELPPIFEIQEAVLSDCAFSAGLDKYGELFVPASDAEIAAEIDAYEKDVAKCVEDRWDGDIKTIETRVLSDGTEIPDLDAMYESGDSDLVDTLLICSEQ